MNVISLFAGAGGLDLGFKRAGFQILWANEYDKTVYPTHLHNFPATPVDTRSITEIDSKEIPYADGLIGSPPCQSFSSAGSQRGVSDKRGSLFYEYIRVLRDKQPDFFVAENVAGLLHPRHRAAFEDIVGQMRECGYRVSHKLLNAADFGVPQDRKRVFFVGLKDSLGKDFVFPEAIDEKRDLFLAVGNLGESPDNHDIFTGTYSPQFMSRNRVRAWDDPSFTIPASARHIPLHPQAPKMEKTGKDQYRFRQGEEYLYRRLSVRECARIQTFPDDFRFLYDKVENGYKMVGNAVPVKMAEHLACAIVSQIYARA